MEKRQGLEVPQGNLLAALADSRVQAAALGVLGANLSRKAIIKANRDAFGTAVIRNAEVVYEGKDGKKIPNAKTNRMIMAGAQTLLGTVVMAQAANAELDYAALGLAASGFANVIMALFDLD